jgi:hypothetical protein
MYIYIVIIIIILFAIYKERQALGCPNIPDGTDCDNANGKAVKGTKPSNNDSNNVIYEKIILGSKVSERMVTWRLSLLLSFFCVFIMYFFMYQRIPLEKELAIGMFVITAIVYFTLNFYKFHLYDYVENNIFECIEILRSREQQE